MVIAVSHTLANSESLDTHESYILLTIPISYTPEH